VNFWVVASGPDLSGAATATGLNLSLTGMLLETSVKGLDLNAELDFDIRLPGGDALAGCGRVVRLAGLGQYGVEFAALSADAADAVLRFVETAGGH
jgi:hypothetical protein